MYKLYSKTQHSKTYRSTIDLVKFISKYVNLEKKTIIDLACGGGASTIYLAEKYKSSSIIGIDIDTNLLRIAKDYKNKRRLIIPGKFFSIFIIFLKSNPYFLLLL